MSDLVYVYAEGDPTPIGAVPNMDPNGCSAAVSTIISLLGSRYVSKPSMGACEKYGPGAHYCNYVLRNNGETALCIISPLSSLMHLWPPLRPSTQTPNSDVDAATLRLVQSSIPVYRNSDICPVARCGRRMDFRALALVCPKHGFTDTRQSAATRQAR